MNSEHAIITKSFDDVILDWNAGARQLLGYDRPEMLGQACSRLIPEENQAEHRETVDRLGRGEEVSVPEATLIHQDGRRIDVRLTASPLRDREGKLIGAVVVAHDLADAKRLQQHYLHAQKMEAFGRLAGGIAHDFNNLLTVILGNTDLLHGQLQPGAEPESLLNEIHATAMRAASLTHQIMAFSHKKPAQAVVLDIEAAISSTETLVRRLIGEDIRVMTLFSFNLPPVKIDPGQLQQVILNLAVNARDAMAGRGGQLIISTGLVDLDASAALTQPAVPPGPYVMFSLQDTGIGMSGATKDRIFEPFFTTKEPGKGSGMGLKTVQDIIKDAGGCIEVESELGEGSTFTVYLPPARAPLSIAQLPPPAAVADLPRGDETILLAEDEEPLRRCNRLVLEQLGYTVLEAADGQAALHALQHGDRPIDLVVADVVMPHLTCRRLAEHLATLHPTVKVIFTSGHTADVVADNGLDPGTVEFLSKPHTPSALALKVREVLDRPARRLAPVALVWGDAMICQ